jgi:hypothetical protein
VKTKEAQVTFWVHILIALLVAGCWFLSHGWELMGLTSVVFVLMIQMVLGRM